MSEKRISYLDRNFNDYRSAIVDMTRKYYNDVIPDLNDASVGSWIVDVFADIADNLSYNIDRAYQETSIDSANLGSSLMNMARTQGVKIPGRKAAVVEVEVSCELPLRASSSTDSYGDLRIADERYAPLLKRGCLFSNGMYTFELSEDLDFSKQFNSQGVSNRAITPNRDTNGNIVSYTYRKLGIAVAGQSKVYKKSITNSDIVPFMTITIDDRDILNVDSIIVKDGYGINTDPAVEEYFVDEEAYVGRDGKTVQRFFETDSLIDQYRYGYEIEKNGDGFYNPVWEDEMCAVYSENDCEMKTVPVRKVARGMWKRLKNKFVTEFNDDWTLNIIFGRGIRNIYGEIPSNASTFTQYMMTRMEANDYLGVLPESGSTVFVRYRVGGGAMTNIAPGTLTDILFLNMTIDGDCSDENRALDARKKRDVQSSLSVTNTTPSYGGKDEPSADEVRYLIKYGTSEQGRCVTLKDYQYRVMMMPPMYGCPFRCGVTEENNKVVIYTLGLDSRGYLKSDIAEPVAENIKTYLSEYRMINDFVEIRSGYIINVGFEVDIFAEKTYNSSEVAKRVIDKVYDYMDIRRHMMGEDIFLGDLEKEISKMDGVQNLIALRCYNRVGSTDGYSDSETTQALVHIPWCENGMSNEIVSAERQIDLEASDKVLFSECNSMFEIKYKNRDIVVNVKQRG